MVHHIFAVTTRGLERVSADEIGRIPDVSVGRILYRRVTCVCRGDLSPLLSLRTVDDVFLDLVTWHGIDHRRRALGDLRQLSARLDLYQALGAIDPIRTIEEPITFSVTANFVGSRNYTADEIKQACAEGVTTGYGWNYAADDRIADLNLRVFIEHERASVGIRLADAPLHKRDYKREHVPGSLKPPVAAALGWLAGAPDGILMVDPTCGAGTVAIEAAAMGARSLAGDVDSDAIAAARTNISYAPGVVDLHKWDARRLPLSDVSIDAVAANLPWGRKVEVDTPLAAFYQRTCREIERVLKEGGTAVLLTNRPEWVKFAHLHFQDRLEISTYGRTPSVLIYGR